MKLVSLLGIIVGLAWIYYVTKRVDAAQDSKAWETKYDRWRKQSANNWELTKANSGLMLIQQKLGRQRTVAHIILIATDIFLSTIVSLVFLAVMAGRRSPFDVGLLVLVMSIFQWLIFKAYSGVTRQTNIFAKIAEERDVAKHL